MNSSILKRGLPYLISIIVFYLISIVYFFPQFQGKVMQQGDLVNYKAMVQEIREYKKETGKDALWTNSMFGGMPTYQMGAQEKNNISPYIKKVTHGGLPRPAGLFLAGMLCFFILMITLKVNVWIAMIASIGFALSTNNMVLFEAGHSSKVLVIMLSPLLVAGTILAYERNKLAGFVLFTIGMSLNLFSNHYQMTYYLGLCLLILVGIYFYNAVKNGTIKSFFLSSALLLLGVFVGVGTSSTRLLTTYEYAKDTMRGKPILTQNNDKASSSSFDGLSWEYAMTWSNGWKDLIASYIPLAVGGASGEMVTKDSALGKKLSKRGVSMRNGILMPTYWGPLPVTGGPAYFGAIFFFLFILGLCLLKGKWRNWLIASVVLTMLLSLGKNFAFFNQLLFDYFPMFNKFRTPNSVLSVTVIFIPLLGGLALHKIVTDRHQSMIKPLLIAAGSTIGFALLLILLGPSIFEFSNPSDARLEQSGINIEWMSDHRISMLRSSSLRTILLIAIAAGATYLFLKEKIQSFVLLLIIGLVGMFDLIQIDLRYLNGEDFVSTRNYDQLFKQRPVDKQILNDKDLHYRVQDLTVNTYNSASSSYYHKTIGGYNPAKMQRYQDMIDYHLSRNNTNVLNMLNTKYVISNNQNGEPQVQLNPAAIGNAWFIKNIRLVGTPDEEIKALSTFDPQAEAIIHNEFADYVKGVSDNVNGNITLTRYAPDELEYTSDCEAEQLAIFSEIWYGPNKGWNAYIDGKKVDHIRANYILRALKIPAGKHTILFKFESTIYEKGSSIAFISSIILALLIALGLFLIVQRFFKKNKSE